MMQVFEIIGTFVIVFGLWAILELIFVAIGRDKHEN